MMNANQNKRRLVLHIGTHKTGSTTIQHVCWMNREPLLENGWLYLSDDIAPINPETLYVYPFPQTPLKRVSDGGEIPMDDASRLRKVEIPLENKQIASTFSTIQALIFPRFRSAATTKINRLKPSKAALNLISNSLNFRDHIQRGLGQFSNICEMVPAYSLEFSEPKAVLELLSTTNLLSKESARVD